MFHGLTMVNFDGQTQNQMMVRPWSIMVDHGQPWSDGQTVAGAILSILQILTTFNLYYGRPRMGLSVNNKQKVRQAVVKILGGVGCHPHPLARYVLNRNGLTIRGLIRRKNS